MENQEAFMLETQHVSKHYGKLEVLKDINLQVKKGEVICLIGRPARANPPICAR